MLKCVCKFRMQSLRAKVTHVADIIGQQSEELPKSKFLVLSDMFPNQGEAIPGPWDDPVMDTHPIGKGAKPFWIAARVPEPLLKTSDEGLHLPQGIIAMEPKTRTIFNTREDHGQRLHTSALRAALSEALDSSAGTARDLACVPE